MIVVAWDEFEAKIEGGVWTSDNVDFQAALNAILPVGGFSEMEPNPDRAAAKLAADVFPGLAVVSDNTVTLDTEGPEGEEPE